MPRPSASSASIPPSAAPVTATIATKRRGVARRADRAQPAARTPTMTTMTPRVPALVAPAQSAAPAPTTVAAPAPAARDAPPGCDLSRSAPRPGLRVVPNAFPDRAHRRVPPLLPPPAMNKTGSAPATVRTPATNAASTPDGIDDQPGHRVGSPTVPSAAIDKTDSVPLRVPTPPPELRTASAPVMARAPATSAV